VLEILAGTKFHMLEILAEYGSHATGWDAVVPGIAVVLALSWPALSTALT
jgi:hypothetical protein